MSTSIFLRITVLLIGLSMSCPLMGQTFQMELPYLPNGTNSPNDHLKLSGIIIDEVTNKPISGAILFVGRGKKLACTDANGAYSITLHDSLFTDNSLQLRIIPTSNVRYAHVQYLYFQIIEGRSLEYQYFNGKYVGRPLFICAPAGPRYDP